MGVWLGLGISRIRLLLKTVLMYGLQIFWIFPIQHWCKVDELWQFLTIVIYTCISTNKVFVTVKHVYTDHLLLVYRCCLYLDIMDNWFSSFSMDDRKFDQWLLSNNTGCGRNTSHILKIDKKTKVTAIKKFISLLFKQKLLLFI